MKLWTPPPKEQEDRRDSIIEAQSRLILAMRVEIDRARRMIGSDLMVHTGPCVSDSHWGTNSMCGSEGCWIMKSRQATDEAQSLLDRLI